MDPITLALLIGLGAIGTAGFVISKKNAPPSPDIQPIPRFRGQLRRSQLYRVWARITPQLISESRAKANPGESGQQALAREVTQRIERMGFGGTLTAIQDPTDNTVFTIVTRWNLPSSETYDEPNLRLYQIQEVEEPPVTFTMTQPEPPNSLDSGLTFDEVEAIRYALGKDDDPRHLGGFAVTLEPDFPVAASILRAKASLASARSMGEIAGTKERTRRQRQLRRFRHAAVHVGGFDPIGWVEKAGSDVLDTLKDLTKDLGKTVEDAWNKYGGIVEVMGGWVPGPQIWAAELAFKVVKDISEGKPVAGVLGMRVSEQSQRFAKGMQATSPFVAMIPGLGTGIAMMMNASAALALGQPLQEAAIDTIALLVPGGAVTQTAFRSAAHMGAALARGERIEQAALEAARAALPSDEARVAFDAGLALARGQSLQDAGFQALYQLTKGNDIATRAAHFAEAAVKAQESGKSVKDVILDELSDDLLRVAKSKIEALEVVKRISSEIVKDGSLLQKFPAEVARQLGIPEEIAQAAIAAVKEVSDGIRVIDQNVIDRLAPLAKGSRIPISPSALQLVLAMQRPTMSLAAKPELAEQRVSTIVQSAAISRLGTAARSSVAQVQDAYAVRAVSAAIPVRLPDKTDAVRAKESLDRAAKALERGRWVDWYRRLMLTETEHPQRDRIQAWNRS